MRVLDTIFLYCHLVYGVLASIRPQCKSLAAGYLHTCAITSHNSHVTCWGGEESSVRDVPTPKQAVVAVTAGLEVSHAVKEADGKILNWGTFTKKIPDIVVSDLGDGGFTTHMCAVAASNGIATCWGDDLCLKSSASPTDVALSTVSAGGVGSCGVLSRLFDVFLLLDLHIIES